MSDRIHVSSKKTGIAAGDERVAGRTRELATADQGGFRGPLRVQPVAQRQSAFRAAVGAEAGPRLMPAVPSIEDRQTSFRTAHSDRDEPAAEAPLEENGAIQRREETAPPIAAPTSRRNDTGLPDTLKTGIETLSGFSLDDVKVHYGSSRPAQLQALAYTQGADIHVGPGQEKHLPHEAWHVVQQKQGRVKPTVRFKGVGIDDRDPLEREADTMSARALSNLPATASAPLPAQPISAGGTVQRRVGYEFETNIGVTDPNAFLPPKKAFYQGGKWHAEPDQGNIEFVTEPLSAEDEVSDVLNEIVGWGKQLLAVPVTAPSKSSVSSNVNDKEKPEQQTIEELPNEETVRMMLAELDFSESETNEAIEYGLSIVWNLIKKDPPSKEDILGLAKMFSEMDRKRSKATQPDLGELEVIEHASYRDLDAMEVANNWLRNGLRALGADDRITASPQATIGTALHRIGDLMQAIPQTPIKSGGSSGSTTLTAREPAHGELLAKARGLAVQAVTSLRNNDATDQEWAELEGLLGLMVSYILMGQYATQKFFYSKDIAPLMSRVDFLAMYKALAEVPRKLFKPLLVAKTAGVDPTTPVFGEVGFGKGEGGRPVTGPTVGEWVVSILENSDVMSLIGQTEVVNMENRGAPSMGAEGALDKIDTKVPKGLVPLELRRIGGSVPLEDWPSMAVEIFRFAAAFDDRFAKSEDNDK